ncbi:MAG: 3-deoxy-8-phosphooctulonate synthase [Aminivibrio sp.]|jgi:2-dehydro-3-deoxyphosphooctonate aldolase (KDO 8-P synthase)|nr:3-deoxy-8-phosphooctulonate synthase [Synergistaceae bacterium]
MNKIQQSTPFSQVRITDPGGGGRWDFSIGGGELTLIAGPCALESPELGLEVAETVRDICRSFDINYIFKASFDKANRTSVDSYRGPGLEEGLEQLSHIGRKAGVPVITDIHESWQAERAAKYADILQIPAFLCRQTDLLLAAAKTGRPLNIKKAQFLAPLDMAHVVKKCRDGGAGAVMLCERGTFMGYGRLVTDMTSLPLMRSLGCPVVFDGTHSVQAPGAAGGASGGDRRLVLPLVRAALAAGVDALFLETHPDPDRAKSDGPNMVPLSKMKFLLEQAAELHAIVGEIIGMPSLDWAEAQE